MVFPIVGGDGKPTGYEIENSLRFNDDDSPNLTDRPASGNRKTFTFSTWFKRSNLKPSGENFLFGGSSDGANDTTEFKLQNDQLTFIIFDGSSNTSYVRTNAVLRDVSAWYHVVFRIDLTQATNTDRIRLYINGVLQTSLDQTTYDAQNNDSFMSLGNGYHRIGADARSAANFFDGYMAETYYIDGQSYDPTYFGKFDDNNVWIPVEPGTGDGGSITYGTNGFLLEYKQTGTSANSSGIGADTSGQDNHLTPTNFAAIDVTEDTPTNNFATMSSIHSDRQQGGAATFADGNLQITTTYVDSNYQRYPQVYSTQAVSSGKWYFEMKITTSDTDSFIGIFSPDNYASDREGTNNPYGGYEDTGAIYTSRGAVRIDDGQTTGHGNYAQNDIVGCALDIDNNKVYFHRNGTYVQSGDPAGNSGGQAIPSGTLYGFTVGNDTASDSGTMQVNFGNPIHTISSGNTDGKYGNFEYAVPSGFYAVCTKRLAQFGQG